MEQLQSFLQLDYADEILIGVGVLLVFFSVLKIISSSIKMLFWVLLAAIGVVSLSYGFEQSPLDLPGISEVSLPSLADIAANTDSDVLKFICEKFDAGG